MFKINKLVANNNKCLIIAEAGVNHNGSLKIAEKLIKSAKESGADIIKFQTYKASRLVISKSPRFWKWDGETKKKGTQYDSYSTLDSFNYIEYKKLFNLCKKYKIEFMSTPFDTDAVKMLNKIGMKAFKIASCDITNYPLILEIIKTKKPILLSTGASNIKEIKDSINFITSNGKNKICIMHCTLCYPTKPQDANLQALLDLKKNFPHYTLGFSDHTLGTNIATSSINYGVRVIEKHFTVNKKLKKSADHWLSIDPKELKLLRKNVDEIVMAQGKNIKEVLKCESISRKFARRSIVAKEKIFPNTKINLNHLDFKRPGTGLSPKLYKSILGKKSKYIINKDQMIKKNLLK